MKVSTLLCLGYLALAGCATNPNSRGAQQPATTSPQCEPGAANHAAAPGMPNKPGMMGAGMMGHGLMGGMGKDGMKGMECPMKVPGTTVRAEEVEGGSAMVFSTTGDVAELRRRVAAMAAMHNEHAGKGCPMMAMHGQSESAPADAASTAPAASTPAPVDHEAHHPKTGDKPPAAH